MKKKSFLIVSIALITTISLFFQACKEEEINVAPVASFTISPDGGGLSVSYYFSASASTDAEDSANLLMVRWDFEGDGNWDTDWSYSKTYRMKYSDVGNFTVQLEVKDTEGLTDLATRKNIVVDDNGVTETMKDPRDGQIYNTVVIGKNKWFAENLNFEMANSWYYDDDAENGSKYGRLYSWEGAREACPSGWHLPSDDEWKQIEEYLGMSYLEITEKGWRGTDEGKRLKLTSNWFQDGNGTNTVNFSGLPGGWKDMLWFEDYVDINILGKWWSSTKTTGSFPCKWVRELRYDEDRIRRWCYSSDIYLSVRCVKD